MKLRILARNTKIEFEFAKSLNWSDLCHNGTVDNTNSTFSFLNNEDCLQLIFNILRIKFKILTIEIRKWSLSLRKVRICLVLCHNGAVKGHWSWSFGHWQHPKAIFAAPFSTQWSLLWIKGPYSFKNVKNMKKKYFFL